VYDITDPHSLDNLDHWRREFLQHVGGGGLGDLDPSLGQSSFPFVVLGNKMDKVSRNGCLFANINFGGKKQRLAVFLFFFGYP
jgi:hypothetical protein